MCWDLPCSKLLWIILLKIRWHSFVVRLPIAEFRMRFQLFQASVFIWKGDHSISNRSMKTSNCILLGATATQHTKGTWKLCYIQLEFSLAIIFHQHLIDVISDRHFYTLDTSMILDTICDSMILWSEVLTSEHLFNHRQGAYPYCTLSKICCQKCLHLKKSHGVFEVDKTFWLPARPPKETAFLLL